MKTSYGNFFIQSQSRNDFLTRGKSISSNQKSAVKKFKLLLAPLQSPFTEVCRVSTSLLKFSRKLAINHRQSWNGFIALDKPIKKYIQKEQSKKTRSKTRGDVRWSLLTNFSTEGRGKKISKEGKCAVSIFDDNDFYQARKCLEARSKRFTRARQGKQIKRSWSEVNISKNSYPRIWRSDQVLALGPNENTTWYLLYRMKGENLVGVENLSEYKINKWKHGKCFVRYFRTRFCIRKLTRSLRSLVRFLTRQQRVRNRTRALSMN